jgi:FkbM family methyltransferase
MNLYRAVRRGTLLKALVGLEPFHWVRPTASVVELGSKYGGWGIDSGRLPPAARILSFGLGEDVSFETALVERFGCRVVGFDPTPRAVEHVRSRTRGELFQAHPLALADHDGTLSFALPPESAADQVSASAFAHYGGDARRRFEVPCATLATVRERFGLDRVDVLKMDVEGAEYDVIAQATRLGWLGDIDQILVEFHHFLPGLDPRRTRIAIAQLRSAGFRIAWIGRTNHEYLFVREGPAGAA